jgi:REP element-mobilizing transposase RayT
MNTFYHRHLPHWLPPDAVFFITFRLANSVPASIVAAWQQEQERAEREIRALPDGPEKEQKLAAHKEKRFYDFDAWLDRCLRESPRWLADEQIARIVTDALHAFDRKRYNLIAYCVMPNHVHLLIDTTGYAGPPDHHGVTAPYPLADVLKRIKGRTARYCNQALGRSGAFWQPESYDHVVRDNREYQRIVAYILNNPVKAGLVEDRQQWPFSYYAGDDFRSQK